MADVLGLVRVRDRVRALAQRHRFDVGGPPVPGDGGVQPDLFVALAVDVQGHGAGPGLRVGVLPVRVPQGQVVPAVLVRAYGEGGAGARLPVVVDEPGAGVAGVVVVELGAAGERGGLGLVHRRCLRAVGQRGEGVPGLGAPQLLAVVRREGARGLDVDDVAGAEAVQLQRHGPAVLGERRGGDVEGPLVDLRAAVPGGGHVTPLLGLVLGRQTVRRLLGERLGVLDREAAVDRAHGPDVEGPVTGAGELLEAELQLALLAPVPRVPDATGVDRPVRSDADPVDPGLQALRHPEDRALVLAADLLQVGPLESAVGHVTEEHLPGERAVLQLDRVTGRVGDLAVRQPEDGLGHRPVVVHAVRVGVVVVERALLDPDQLRRRHVRALVVGGEDGPLRAPAEAVRCAQAPGHVRHLAGRLLDLQGGAAVGYVLRVLGRAAGDHRDARADVEVPLLVQQPERELVVVAAERPGRDLAVLVGDLVAVLVDQRGETVLLGDVDRAVDVLEAHRLQQVLRDQLLRHLGRVGVPGDVVEQIHLPELALPAAAPGAHGQAAVRQPVHAGDLRFEAGGPQVGQRVVGVDPGERQAVAR